MATGDALSNDGPKWEDVRDAFKEYDHPETLGLSPLADLSFVEAGLVLDPQKPTLKEWGVALQLVLEWAVEQLAPPPEALRVLSWKDAPWQPYLLLYYRYVALFLPEDWDKPVPLSPPKVRNYLGEERETRGLVKALSRLMGLQDATFYQIEEGAFRAVARLLMDEEKLAKGAKSIRKKALEHYCANHLANSSTRTLLFIAATFEAPFPAAWLLAIAEQAQVVDAEKTLDRLLGGRILHRGDNGYLHLSTPLRRYLQVWQLKNSQGRKEREHYHRLAAPYYDKSQPIQAAWHLYHSGVKDEALKLVLQHGQQTLDMPTCRLLLKFWRHLKETEWSREVWVSIQRTCSEHFRLEYPDAALAACHKGLAASCTEAEKADFYHRLGKLCEEDEYQKALAYYEQALACFERSPINQSQVLKDRAWIWIFQEEWGKAKRDLTDALELVGSEAWGQQANIHDVFAALYREQAGSIDIALEHAYCALALRKKVGDRERVAYSYNALGRIYKKKEERRTARENYLKAARIFKNLGRRAELATVYLNLGALVYEQRNYQRAVKWYYEPSLNLFCALEHRLGQVQAHYNLAEGYAKLGKFALGLLHWHLGDSLCRREPEIAKQVEEFKKLAVCCPALVHIRLKGEELKVLHEVQRRGSIKRAEAIALLQRRRESWVRRLLKRLTNAQLLTRLPSGPTTRYVLTD